ncbi:MAG TPA: DEAD/DEAH box helicase [Candidatus Edwardsbacteria bacterium]|nr:DEAD/DEAH box helicase [Candidatus Edwardsbacteria bacterium]
MPTPANFEDLQLIEPLLRAVREEGYLAPTPIQAQAIPHALAGRDVLGCAQTGTGKTAAFALPILQKLDRPEVTAQRYRSIRALIVTPTRELAAQIGESFKAYGRHTQLKYAVVYGGVYQGIQVKAMYGGVDILVATPGRLLDLMEQRLILLSKVEILVLDEADRMLDMGFINDIKKIVAKVPARRQTLFFSATMPAEIRTLAGGILDNPVPISVTPDTSAAETVEQSVYFVERDDKADLLRQLLADPALRRALVFTRTKVRADRVARKLTGWGIPASAIHGDKSQGARERVLAAFKSGAARVLVASDVVSRGIDIEDISHVINFDVPHEPEAYVHRIGRTGRAGAAGTAITFCDREERDDLRQVEKLLGRPIPVVSDHRWHSTAPAAAPGAAPRRGGGHAATGPRGQYGRGGNRRRRG